ncbi:MAG: HDOD domain-containing protein [Pseudomonadota bacterium]
MLATPGAVSPQTDGLQEKIGARLAAGDLDIPMLPRVAGAVIALTQDPTADMASLARFIQQDPALASRVMKIANSPSYRGVTPMASLQQAIARLGMKVMGEVALAASIGARVFSARGYESDMQALWHHAVLSAGWAREIARIRRTNVEAAFMCGLLHQIGKPVVLQLVTELSPVPPTQAMLSDIISEFYVPAGAQLAGAWGLPAMVVTTINCHNRYETASEFPNETMIVAAARRLATEPDSTGNEVLQHLNFYDDDIEALLAALPRVSAMAQVMAL